MNWTPIHRSRSVECEFDRRSDDSRQLPRSQVPSPKSASHNSRYAMEEGLRWGRQGAAEISGTAAHRRSVSGGGDNPVTVETWRNVRFDQHVGAVPFEDMKQ